jgi:hypothetical protein
VLKQIDDLVRLYWRVPDCQTEIAYQNYRATSYWMKYVGVKFKGTERRMDLTEGLNIYTKKSFAKAYDLDLDEIDDLLLLIFGTPVYVAHEDTEVFNEDRAVLHVKDVQNRRKYKLIFRRGLVGKRNEEGNLYLYDTKNEKGKDADGEAIFVMDRWGRIYTGSHNRGEFHHSSVLAGFWSTSAGGEEDHSWSDCEHLPGQRPLSARAATDAQHRRTIQDPGSRFAEGHGEPV